jgi:hypothetical protein
MYNSNNCFIATKSARQEIESYRREKHCLVAPKYLLSLGI